MVKELIRDTVLGHALRLFSKSKVLPFEEERDPELWRRYIDKEKSGQMAHHGYVGDEQKEEKDEEKSDEDSEAQRQNGQDRSEGNDRRNSSDTSVASQDVRTNETSGVPIDPEKGRDVTIVTWYSDDDPEVSLLLITYIHGLTISRTR